MLPPLIPMLYIFTFPESPRFLLHAGIKTTDRKKKAKYIQKAFNGLKRLNKTELQASRELISIYYSLKNSLNIRHGAYTPRPWYHTVGELWTEVRTRNALCASALTMFLQQFCGVNIMAYYSTTVLQSLILGDSTSGQTNNVNHSNDTRLTANRLPFYVSPSLTGR